MPAVIDPDAFYTFSSLFVCGALVALMNKWFTAAGITLTVAGAAGVGIFWERWSSLAGDDVHVAALVNPVAPTRGQIELLATHLPMLLAGAGILAAVAWRRALERTTG